MASRFLLILIIICSIAMGMGGSAGGKTSQLTLGSSGGSASSEVVPAAGTTATTAAGNSPLLPKDYLSLPPLGSPFGFGGNCSSMGCVVCLLENIGSCLSRALTCVHPKAMVQCFVAKFFIVENCFDDTGAELTPPAGKLTSLPPSWPATSCSEKCTQCLIEKIGSCSFAAASCVDLWEFPRCVAENIRAFHECFGT